MHINTYICVTYIRITYIRIHIYAYIHTHIHTNTGGAYPPDWTTSFFFWKIKKKKAQEILRTLDCLPTWQDKVLSLLALLYWYKSTNTGRR